MRFLVVPEDFRNDQYLLEPILTQLLVSLDFAKPKLRVCRDPLLGGVTEALNPTRLDEVVTRHAGMVDVYLLCVDRDGQPGRQGRLEEIERRFAADRPFIAVQALEELETWALAGLDLPDGWRWQDIRSHRDVKEAYFEPLAERRRLSSEPGGGRRTLGREAARRIDRIRQLCPEFDELANRLGALRDRA